MTPARGRRGPAAAPGSDDWLVEVGRSAAAASGVSAELLGEFLPMLAQAAVHGRRPAAHDLDAVRELGRRAAEQGVGPGQTVELYLTAAWRLWQRLPLFLRSDDSEKVRAAAAAVLRALDDAVAALVESHQSVRRRMIRHEEALRREFVDDLLRGDADIARMMARAEPFGLDFSQPHQVGLVEHRGSGGDADGLAALLERSVVDRFGDRDVLVATKDDRVVVLVPAASPLASRPSPDVAELLREQLRRVDAGDAWRVGVGRAFPGVYGVARSYEEAGEALLLAARLRLDADVVHARDVLVYRVLGRDQAAIVDLVRSVLTPLEQARGGPEVLLDTLQAYFDAAEVATDAARRLHVSVRTVTYRLARVAQLTGYSVSRPDERFALHTAVLGARLLDWPVRPLPAAD
jgi:sugar diacid utilization regulator